MFASVAAFELRYQLKNPVLWIAGGLFFLLTFLSVTISEVSIGGRGNTHVNSPYAIGLTLITLSVFFMFVTTAFVANVVTRDDDTGFGPILRATRITKGQYLFGRFLGGYAAAAIAFAFVPLAMMVGSMMWWVDAEKVGPFLPGAYLYAYAVWALPTLFFTGALFFALATATRSMMATYVGVVAVLILFFVSRALVAKLSAQAWEPWLDPFGVGAFSQATRYFTTAERNATDPPMTTVLVASRLVWIGLGAGLLALAYAVFRVEDRGGRSGRRERMRGAAETGREVAAAPPPAAAPGKAKARHDIGSAFASLTLRTRFEMGLVFRSPAFFILLALGLINALFRLSFLDGFYGSALYPTTRNMVQGLRESFSIIPVIVAIYYAGDLVWRDRERRIDEIVDSAPAPDWTFAVPKMAAIALVLFALMLVSVVAAIGVQLVKGGVTPDLAEYLGWYVAPDAVDLVQLAFLAVFVQAVSPHKFVGWGIMVVIQIALLTFAAMGLENHLYLFASGPDVPLSDMNGQGYFAVAGWWYRGYWTAVSLVLAVLAYGLWRRGANVALRPRLRRLPGRLAGPAGGLLAASLVAAVAIGGFVWWNVKVLNTYRTGKDVERLQAEAEKQLLPFESLPQPKIQAVTMRVDLLPRRHQAVTHGTYVVRNDTATPIRQIHLRFDPDLKVRAVSVEGARSLKTYESFNYRIYAFDMPMAPGETRRVAFETLAGQPGFKNSGNTTRIVGNGSFVDNSALAPYVGMSRDGLLTDRSKRRKYGLPPELRPPKLEDASGRQFNALRRDSDWVSTDVTVSTDADQTPIAPGYKVSDVTAGGRRTARFRSEAPIQNFFSIQSARYAEKHVAYKGVDLGVYYDPHHPWNVDRMIAALKAALDRDQAAFSPYQFRQVRILEFPGFTGSFAQSFANTIPYSEDIGFTFKPPKDFASSDKIDMVTYVTAHELGHQWWAHQVIGSENQGGEALAETFAQYSALMTMEAVYGGDQIRRFLKYELDRYLRARGGDPLEELPLERVEAQPYIYYQKGSLVMYRLRDALGRDAVDASLKGLIGGYAFKAAPYPRTLEYLPLLQAQAGADPRKQALIGDLWSAIALYDLTASAASAHKRPDGRWDVTLRFAAKKVHADGQGRETPAPLDEAIDVGVFARDPSKPGFSARDVLWLKPAEVRGGGSVTVTVDRPPRFAGIDPYAKLIDRNTDDNLMPVAVR